MKILFDHQIFVRQKRGGITRYFSELMTNLKRIPHTEAALSVVYSDTIYLKESGINIVSADTLTQKSTIISFIKSLVQSNKKAQYLYSLFKKILNKRNSIRALKEQNFDVFHPTFYDPYFLSYIQSKPFVITVHDMMHELFPHLFSDSPQVSKNKKNLAQHAARIIAITEHTKQDLIKMHDINPLKIDVIYHATSLNPEKSVHIEVPSKFILFVGGRASYKNFDTCIESLAPLLISYDLSMLCIGGDTFRDHEGELFKKLGIEQRMIQRSVTDAELAYVYSKALCFVFPSLYEGFGMPILEAFACHCPVVLSNTSCFPEIAQDAGVYFDPTSNKSIYSSVHSVITSSQLQDELRNKGIERLKDFSWNTCAQKSLQTYTRCIDHAKH